MANDFFLTALIAWLLAAAAALFAKSSRWPRALLALGCVAAATGALAVLPGGSETVRLPLGVAGHGMEFVLAPSAVWLLLFGAVAGAPTVWLGTPARQGASGWSFGAAATLIGALGVFGVQDGLGFLIAWELMSLGGAVMVLSERLDPDAGKPVLFMLALLEFGSVALMLAILLLAGAAGSLSFSDFAHAQAALSAGERLWIALLLLVGFGAKLGLLPFYEWFPQTYGSGSGATGALLSGIILNAAFFGLARGLTSWIGPADGAALATFDAIVVSLAVVTSILTALYAFQQEDWRGLLSLSSAENGSVAVALLGVSLVFSRNQLPNLAGLAFIVALLHLAAHTLAKSALFLTADGVFESVGSYELRQSGILRRSVWAFGVGAIFSGMSLAAMPPQSGFVSEWYLFQTMFQGFHLSGLGGRLLLAAAGAGFALTAAIALATFVKVLGIGLLGRGEKEIARVGWRRGATVGMLGLAVLALAVGMPAWLEALEQAVPPGYGRVAETMRDGWLLVPLTSSFAFISPSKLIIVMPLLALLPLSLLFFARRGRRARLAPVWYGGREQDPARAATTALAFSNALRTFYSFVYRPSAETTHELSDNGSGRPYFIRRLIFSHDVAPLFGPSLFEPLERLVVGIATRLRALQSGHLNFYLALIGILLVIILAAAIL